MKSNAIPADIIYDENLEPFYTSIKTFNNRTISLYDLDKHSNKELLARNSYVTEYYTKETECLIMPKTIATNLFLTDDDVLVAYFNTQEEARVKFMRGKAVLAIVTLAFIVGMALNLFQIVTFNLLFVTLPYLLFYMYTNLFKKNAILKESYVNFIKVIQNNHSKQDVKNNLETLIEHIKQISYMNDKQKIKTIKHFENLYNMIK